ncbi:MAG TPA: hypothetical protein VNM50_07650, partial [Chloroflexota bacterium]|nr:hypothetical protein [Chloroflexota bacterium]
PPAGSQPALDVAATGPTAPSQPLRDGAPTHVSASDGVQAPTAAARDGETAPPPAPSEPVCPLSSTPGGEEPAGAPPPVETRLQDLAARQRSGTAELRRSIRDVIERLEEDEPPPPRRPKRARR